MSDKKETEIKKNDKKDSHLLSEFSKQWIPAHVRHVTVDSGSLALRLPDFTNENNMHYGSARLSFAAIKATGDLERITFNSDYKFSKGDEKTLLNSEYETIEALEFTYSDLFPEILGSLSIPESVKTIHINETTEAIEAEILKAWSLKSRKITFLRKKE